MDKNFQYLFVYLDTSFLFEHIGKQIETLIVKTKQIFPPIDSFDLSDVEEILENRKIFLYLFQQCCTKFTKLRYLNFTSFVDNQQLVFDFENPISFSSNLWELHVQVDSLNDCLYILDCHFNQLSKLSITICGLDYLPSANHKTVSCSLISFFTRMFTNYYLIL